MVPDPGDLIRRTSDPDSEHEQAGAPSGFNLSVKPGYQKPGARLGCQAPKTCTLAA
jgi:hypothetical protein